VTRDAPPRSAPANAARALLAPALADLEGLVAPPSFATRALEHAAHAMSALYAAEAEAETEAAATSGLRKALDELSHALDALHEAPDRHGVIDRATSAVAHALAFLYPLVTAAQRQRREVLLPGAVASSDRDALRALAGSEAVPVVARTKQVEPFETSDFARREQRRTSERTLVEVDIGLLSDSNFYTGLSGDISQGGVFVATESPLPAGATVTLYFKLPGGRSVRADGSVRWARGRDEGRAAGMGVVFLSLGDDDRRAIADYCAKRPPFFHE